MLNVDHPAKMGLPYLRRVSCLGRKEVISALKFTLGVDGLREGGDKTVKLPCYDEWMKRRLLFRPSAKASLRWLLGRVVGWLHPADWNIRSGDLSPWVFDRSFLKLRHRVLNSMKKD